MWQFETVVSRVLSLTPDIKTFRLDVAGKGKIEYQAGQYFFVTIMVGGSEAQHHFTISSSPTETARGSYLEFTKRITGSDFSKALDQLKPGDWVKLRGPEGDFVLPPQKQNLAFLSGGIGITPLRSMLRYIVDKDLKHDVFLLYGNNTFENIAFREELEEMVRIHKNLRMEYVLSGPAFPENWQGKKGFITKELVMDVIPDFKKRIYYLSGPMRMVLGLEEQLADADVPPGQIKRDYFPGYD